MYSKIRELNNELTELLGVVDKSEDTISKLELKAAMYKAKAFGNESLYARIHHQYFTNCSNYNGGSDEEYKHRTLQMMVDDNIISPEEYDFCIE